MFAVKYRTLTNFVAFVFGIYLLISGIYLSFQGITYDTTLPLEINLVFEALDNSENKGFGGFNSLSLYGEFFLVWCTIYWDTIFIEFLSRLFDMGLFGLRLF